MLKVNTKNFYAKTASDRVKVNISWKVVSKGVLWEFDLKHVPEFKGKYLQWKHVSSKGGDPKNISISLQLY